MLKKYIVFIIIVCLCMNLFACQTPFSSQKEFEYEIYDGYVTINRYLGSDINVKIPSQLDNSYVQKIGTEAFYQCVDIVSISLPDTITEIESSAFYKCYSLSAINLTKNIRKIGENPFFRCTSLDSIIVDRENEDYSDIDGVLFNKDQTELIAYPEGKQEVSYNIPSSVISISDGAFGYKTNLKTIFIPSGVTKMPDYNLFIYSEEITLKVESDSAAEQYAKKYDINYIIE